MSKVATVKKRQLPLLQVAHLNLSKTELYGIENIKKSFDVVIEVSEQVVSISKEFNYRKLISFAFKLAEYGNIVDVLKESLNEFKDLSSVEAEMVADHFKDRFDIENETLEERIERGIDLIERGYQLAPLVIEYGGDVADYVGEWKEDIDIARA